METQGQPPPLIYRKMAAVMRKIKPIAKDHTNKQQGYAYRRVDDFYNALHDVMAEEGVFVVPEILDRERLETSISKSGAKLYRIINHYRFHFYAEDGSSVPADADGEATDSGDKASNKAASAAMKYALMQSFLVPTKDLADSDDETIEHVDPAALQATTQSNQMAPQSAKTKNDFF